MGGRLHRSAGQVQNEHGAFGASIEPKGFGDFPKLGLLFWGVARIRTIVFWDLYWGPLMLGNYHLGGTYSRDRSSCHGGCESYHVPREYERRYAACARHAIHHCASIVLAC